ncbi:hypothetical protein BCR43DRAFT_489123 [Syncephalastrum racemosum]|uniref:NADH-ubiquinone reductase complex 1 MLRQ subunit-domain-containing protein n=1 Tax=Syncephalastrum racemosum TaxID=13706 RepID=A0A1X2HJV8_SYNRA|nr:hypothetical protein BCR43DRAFT_489123 [Syncephalastrum racemosum]
MFLMGHLRLTKKTMPKEVYPLIAIVGTGLTGGITAGFHKLRTDRELRKHGE